MRNFLVASVLLLSACSDAPVKNQNDSAVADSSVAIIDTTVIKPESNVLDTIAILSNTPLIRPSSAAIANAMKKNTTAYWEIMDTMTGDLNRDKYMDMLIVLRGQDDQERDSVASRPLLILLSNPDGALNFAVRNDNVVLCYDCGGVFGDPYDGLAIKNGYFSVEHYGGSSWKWTKIITFKFSEKENTWLLHRDAGVSFNSGDPEGTETDIVDHKEDYGKLKFVDYNYN